MFIPPYLGANVCVRCSILYSIRVSVSVIRRYHSRSCGIHQSEISTDLSVVALCSHITYISSTQWKVL